MFCDHCFSSDFSSMNELILGPEKTSTPLSRRVWQKLPEAIREVLVPLVNSHYSVVNETEKNDDLPVYKYSKDFSKWISTWSSHLMTKITNNPQILQVFLYYLQILIRLSGNSIDFKRFYDLRNFVHLRST